MSYYISDYNIYKQVKNTKNRNLGHRRVNKAGEKIPL